MREIWDEKNECMSREDLEQVQVERLQATLNRVYRGVEHYHRVFSEQRLAPEDLQELSDLQRFPCTVKEDLQRGYPYDLFALPLREVVRIHSSSGTRCKPTAGDADVPHLRRALPARVPAAVRMVRPRLRRRVRGRPASAI